MVAHIQQQANALIEALKAQDFEPGVQSRVQALSGELEGVNSGDFVAAERHHFVESRRRTRRMSDIRDETWKLVFSVSRGGQVTRADVQSFHPLADTLEIPSRDRALFKEDTAAVAGHEIKEFAWKFFEDLAGLLEKGFGGEGSHIEKRTFDWVKDRELRAIVERDYNTTALVAHHSMSGSPRGQPR